MGQMSSWHEPGRKGTIQKCTVPSRYPTRANYGTRGSGGDSAAPLASGVDVPPDTPDEEDETGIADEDVYGGVPTGPDDGGTHPVPNDTMVTPAETSKPIEDPFERIREKDSTYVPTRSPMELSEQWIHSRCRTYEPETWKQRVTTSGRDKSEFLWVERETY